MIEPANEQKLLIDVRANASRYISKLILGVHPIRKLLEYSVFKWWILNQGLLVLRDRVLRQFVQVKEVSLAFSIENDLKGHLLAVFLDSHAELRLKLQVLVVASWVVRCEAGHCIRKQGLCRLDRCFC